MEQSERGRDSDEDSGPIHWLVMEQAQASLGDDHDYGQYSSRCGFPIGRHFLNLILDYVIQDLDGKLAFESIKHPKALC